MEAIGCALPRARGVSFGCPALRGPGKGTVLACARGRRLCPRRRWVDARLGIRLLAEYRDTDHADVVRPAGARSVRVLMLGKKERGDPLQALAPALDREALVRAEDIPGLVPGGGFAAHRVDAIHRYHRQDVASGAVP